MDKYDVKKFNFAAYFLQRARIVLFFLAVICGSTAQAAISPVSISILDPVQFPSADFKITGVRVSALWGRHHAVYGFDLAALGNFTTHNMSGIQASGGFSINQGDADILGLQAAGGINWNKKKTWVLGVQVAGIANINEGESTVSGVQVALANMAAHTKIIGIQAGAYNVSKEVYGFQIGIINKTGMLHGIQLGLLNFNDRGLFSVSPFLNIGF